MLNKVFRKKLSEEEKEAATFLKKVDIFKNLSDNELAEFVPHMYEREYEEGEVVFFRSDASQALYIVKKGMVELNMDFSDGREEQLYYCAPNDTFGINAIFVEQQRDFNAVTREDHTVLVVIPQSDLINIMSRKPSIKMKVFENFANIYEQMLSKVFTVYRNNVGFFEIKNIFRD